MSGSLPLVVIILAGIVALCWADLGRRQADRDAEDDYPQAKPRLDLDQRFREADGQ